MRAVLNVTGDIGGVVFDQTAKTHLNDSYIYGANPAVLAAGQVYIANQITRAGLEDLFDRARTVYQAYEQGLVVVQIDVCHASCHSSCHNSRIRR